MARLFDDAQSEYLEVTSAPATAVPLTIVFWFKCDDGTKDEYAFYLSDGTLDNSFVGMLNSSGGAVDDVRAYTFAESIQPHADTTTTWTTDTWHHAAYVFAANDSRAAYLDGAGKGTNATSATPTGIDLVRIGRVGSSYYSGALAEVAIWDVALSDEQVATLAGGSAPSLVQAGNLVAYWPLIDDDDDAANGYDLTAYNTPSWAGDHPEIDYGGAIDQVAGVAWASVGQLAGVAEASISEVAGVAAN